MPWSFIGSLADLAYNELNFHRQRDYDELNYRRSLENQEKLWAREDTAVQRRVADLEAAGLNPLLAVGSAASSGITSVHAGSNFSGSTDFSSSLGELSDYLKNNYEAIKEKQEIDVENSKADLANKEATKDLLEAQKKEADVKVLKAIAETENVNQKTRESAYNLEKYQDAGVPTNASQFGKIVADVLGTLSGREILRITNEIKNSFNERKKNNKRDNWSKFKESFKNKAMNKKDFENFLKNQYNH